MPSIEDRLDSVLAEYFQKLDRGDAVLPQTLLASHPELEAELREFFDAASFVENLAGPTQSEQTQMLSVHDTARNSLVGETIVSHSSPHAPREGHISRSEMATHFGRYEIQRLLGQGAMGSVYLAYDPSLQRQIALKIPKFSDASTSDKANPDKANLDMRDRFLREARSAATLRHANICPVYDVGRVDGVHYITMAYIEGRTLAEELRAGRTFEPREIAAIVRKLALALGKAHSAGVIHRDLKPGNIMLDAEGEPVLMDFGLAYREETDELRLTKSGMIVGSPAYMSPEQIDGDPTKIGSGSDIYSLGVVLYEMITGKLPFQGTMMSVIGQIATKEPTPVGQYRQELANSPLERLCRKMLAKQIGDRPQTMQEVARALDYILSGLPGGAVGNALRGVPQEGERGRVGEGEKSNPVVSPAPPPHPLTLSPPLPLKFPEAVLAQERRDRAKMFLATTLILVTLLGLFGAAAGIVYFATDQGTLEITSHADNVKIEVIGDNGTVKVIDMMSGTTVERLKTGNYTVVVQGNDSRVAIDKGKFQISRGSKVAVTAQLITNLPQAALVNSRAINLPAAAVPQPLAQIAEHKSDVRGVAFSPDGKQFVTVGWDRMIHVYDAPTRQRLHSWMGHDQGIYRARYLPDGRLLTSAYDGTIKLWDVAQQDELKLIAGHTGAVTALAVSPDGKRGLSSGSDTMVRFWDLEKLESIGGGHKVDPGGWVWDGTFAPDGKSAATVGFDGKIRFWNPETGEQTGEIAAHQGAALSIVYTAENKVLSGGRDGILRLWDTADKSNLGERAGFSGVWIESLAISMDGAKVLAGLANPDKQTKLAPLAGQCAVLDRANLKVLGYLPTGAPYVYGTAFSSDGSLALIGTGRGGQPGAAQLWDVNAAIASSQSKSQSPSIAEVLQIPGHAEHVTSLSVTGDGKTIVSGSADGTVLARDIEPRLTRRALSGHRRDRQVAVDVSRDGRLIVSGDWDGKLRLNDGSKGVTEIAAAITGGVTSVKLSPDQTKLLTTGGDQTIKVWNAATSELLQTFQSAGTLSDGEFSPSGEMAVTAGLDGQLKIRQVADGVVMKDLPTGGATVYCVSWAPQGDRIAAGFRDGTVRVFSAESGLETVRMVGHADRVRDVVFTPDDNHLNSGSYDRTMRVWNVETGAEVAKVEHEKHIFNALAIAPDGKHVFSAGGIWKPDEEKNEWTPENDYAIRMWRLPESVSPPSGGTF